MFKKKKKNRPVDPTIVTEAAIAILRRKVFNKGTRFSQILCTSVVQSLYNYTGREHSLNFNEALSIQVNLMEHLLFENISKEIFLQKVF